MVSTARGDQGVAKPFDKFITGGGAEKGNFFASHIAEQ
jgi:hypothetical protein